MQHRNRPSRIVDPRTDPLVDIIDRHGFAILAVGSGECDVPGCCGGRDEGHVWSYTIGNSEVGLPELVVLGLAPAHASALIHHVRRRLLDPHPLVVGVTEWLGLAPFQLRHVPDEWLMTDPGRMGGWFHAMGGSAIPVVRQIVWGDAAGRFPDDPACDPIVAEDQPVLAVDPFSAPRRAPRDVRRSVHRRPRPQRRIA